MQQRIKEAFEEWWKEYIKTSRDPTRSFVEAAFEAGYKIAKQEQRPN